MQGRKRINTEAGASGCCPEFAGTYLQELPVCWTPQSIIIDLLPEERLAFQQVGCVSVPGNNRWPVMGHHDINLIFDLQSPLHPVSRRAAGHMYQWYSY